MTKIITDEQNYYDIADAIRSKLGVETLYLPSDMADAIDSIQTGTDLTSEDEGKVVVEDEGTYVLAEQTSQTITQNGTYDTTIINELIANIEGGGGGGSTNILSGDTIPTSDVGSDGNIYLYIMGNVSIVQTYNITDVSMSVTDGALTILGTTAATDSSDGTESGVLIDTNINNVNIRVTPYQGGLQSGVCYSDGTLPTIVTRGSRRKSYDSSSAGHAFSKDDADYYFACAYDNGIGNQVRIDVVPTNQYQQFIIDGTSIYAVYLKVDGSWVPIIGQDIDDVDTGGGDGGEVEPTLPTEYQEVEYVEFDGSSYIDITGREFVPLMYVECDAERTSSSTSELAAIGCSMISNNTRTSMYFKSGNAVTYSGISFGSIYCVDDKFDIRELQSSSGNVSTTKSTVGVNQKTNFFYASISSNGSYNNSFIVLGAQGSNRNYMLVGRVYKVKIGTTSYYLQDSSQRTKGVSFATTTWLKPCYRKSDNVVGFYDTEAGVFYTNGGSGTLTAGPAAN